jgi:ABC-type phosphate transport system auxiliary subunit
MDGATNVFIALIVVGIPIIMVGLLFMRWFRLKEKKLDVDASLAVEKAAQYAASNAELEARVRILEKIVTDGGVHTAAQIEALREMPEPARISAKAEREPSNG